MSLMLRCALHRLAATLTYRAVPAALLCFAAAGPLSAQTAGVSSPMTTAELPAGTRPDKGFVSRLAARAMMAMEAKKLNVTLGRGVELFRLPPTDGSDFIAPLVAHLGAQGFTVSMAAAPATWGVMEKGGRRFVVYFEGKPKEPWLYLGEVSGDAVVAIMSPTAPDAAGGQATGMVVPPQPTAAAPLPAAALTPLPAADAPVVVPAATPVPVPTPTAPPEGPSVPSVPSVRTASGAATGFRYTTTRFNDGWTAADERDWVRGTKGNVVVLVHVAQFDLRAFANLDEATASVWTQLVAPRFREIKNLRVRRPFWSDGDLTSRKHFASADAVEQSTGARLHVVLYRGGNTGRWLEVHTADRTTFEHELTAVPDQDGTNWPVLSNLANVNRFAVAASDLTGRWKSSSSAGVQYVNVYTGNSMGMAASSTSDDYTFRADGSYTSTWKGVDGMVGAQRYAGGTYTGRATVSDWQLTLTNRFQGATDLFAIWFEAVQGGRVLHMRRGDIEELILFRPCGDARVCAADGLD